MVVVATAEATTAAVALISRHCRQGALYGVRTAPRENPSKRRTGPYSRPQAASGDQEA